MYELICAVISATATVICAVVAADGRKRDKENREALARSEKRACQRAKEGQLMLRMISANTELTVGLCDAVKSGHCNGNIDNPLERVKTAQEEYRLFLADIAIEEIKGGGVKNDH